MVAMDLTRFAALMSIPAAFALGWLSFAQLLVVSVIVGAAKKDLLARTMSAWSVTSNLTIAAMTALWGVLASITSPRTAIAIAGLLILTTPLLLPRHDHTPQHERELARSRT